MGAPPNNPRTTPAGFRLLDGFSSVVGMELYPGIALYERTVAPPGMDGGEAIETMTMWNVDFRTVAPRKLITMTPTKFTAAYDPVCYLDIFAAINVAQGITVWFPDGSSVDFFGFLQKFEPKDMEEGRMPEADVTFVPTMTDPADGTEAGGVYNAPSGT